MTSEGYGIVAAAVRNAGALIIAAGAGMGVTVARINPREPWIDAPHLSIPEGALAALTEVGKRLCLLA